MKPRIRALLPCVLLLLSPAAWAQPPAAGNLADLAAEYKAEQEKTTNTRTIRRLTNGARYVELLQELEKTFQEGGLLDSLLVVRTERERWEKDGVLEPRHVVEDPVPLNNIQLAFMKSLDVIDTEIARSLLARAGAYNQRLTELQAELTKEGRIEDALAAKDAAAGLTKDDDVLWAKQVLEPSAASETPGPAPAEAERPRRERPVKPAFTGTHEDRLKQRYTEFYDALKGKQLSAAADLVDPEHTKEVGVNGLRPLLGLLSGAIAIGEGLGFKLVDQRVRLDPRTKTARVFPVMETFGGTNEGDPLTFVFRDGDWYVAGDQSGAGEQPKRGEGARDKRERADMVDAIRERMREEAKRGEGGGERPDPQAIRDRLQERRDELLRRDGDRRFGGPKER